MKVWYLYTRDIGSLALSFHKGGQVKKKKKNRELKTKSRVSN